VKFGLRWIDLLGAVLGAVLVGLLDRLWDGYSWSRTLSTMAIFFVFLIALYIWLNRRREASTQRGQRDEQDQRGGR
jgi:branched-subunit amino acid ABC-type transport system permease component